MTSTNNNNDDKGNANENNDNDNNNNIYNNNKDVNEVKEFWEFLRSFSLLIAIKTVS